MSIPTSTSSAHRVIISSVPVTAIKPSGRNRYPAAMPTATKTLPADALAKRVSAVLGTSFGRSAKPPAYSYRTSPFRVTRTSPLKFSLFHFIFMIQPLSVTELTLCINKKADRSGQLALCILFHVHPFRFLRKRGTLKTEQRGMKSKERGVKRAFQREIGQALDLLVLPS